MTIPRITSDTDPRLTGGAVSEVANTYDLRGDKKGGVYHLCYSIGIEDWAKPASADGQLEPYPPTTLDPCSSGPVRKSSGRVRRSVETHPRSAAHDLDVFDAELA